MPVLRKKAMTDSEVIAIIPNTPRVPTWAIQVNMFRIGSSPSTAKTASTITDSTVWMTEPICGLWWVSWVWAKAAGNSPSRPAT